MKNFTSLQTASQNISKLTQGEHITINNDLYVFNGIGAYKVDNTLSNMFRKIETANSGKIYDAFIGKKYLPTSSTSEYEYVEVMKQNKNGTYNVQPVKKNGKRGSAGSTLRQDLERWKEYKEA